MSQQGENEPDPGRHRKGRGVLALALVAVVGAAGAGFATGSLVGGGGTQPEDILPADTVAFADLDLDPPAAQKLNVVRLLGRLPEVQDDYGPEPDLRELALRAVTGGTPLADAGLDQWMGDRLAVALVPAAGSAGLSTVLALQVSDTDAAVDALTGLLGRDRVAATGDYVVVTGAGNLATDLAPLTSTGSAGTGSPPSAHDLVTEAERASLSDSEKFTAAFSHLDEGIASVYVDGDAVADVMEGRPAVDQSLLAPLTVGGQSAAVVRAEPDALELMGWSSTPLPGSGQEAELAARLPEQTVLALEGTDGAELVAARWQQLVDSLAAQGGSSELDRRLAQLEAQLGVALPDDLQTLAGEDAVIAVDGGSLFTGVPGAGLRSVTDPAAAGELADRLQQNLAELTGGFGIVAEPVDDGLVVATTDDYAATLSAGDGDLGGSDRFDRALPDAADASYLAWIDVAALSGPLLLAAPESAATLAPLDSVGVTVTAGDDGTAVRARLVFAEDDG